MRIKKSWMEKLPEYRGGKMVDQSYIEKGNTLLETFSIEKEDTLVVELAMGKGKFITELALQNPDKIFIGVDIKEERVFSAIQKTIEKDIKNCFFICGNIQNIEIFFPKNSIDELWVNFPDPWPKKRHAKRRLTSPRFHDLYKSVIKKGAHVLLKTDNQDLYDYTQEVLEEVNANVVFETTNLQDSNYPIQIVSEFERKFLDREIMTKLIEWNY